MPKTLKRNRLLRGHFKADGLPKKGFEREYDATEFLRKIKQIAVKTVYPCDFCDKFHVGGR